MKSARCRCSSSSIPDLPDYVDTITLQYTFFDTASTAANSAL